MAENRDRFDKLSTRADGNERKKFCIQCGQPLTASGCSECGWRPVKAFPLPIVAAIASLVLLVAIFVVSSINFHEYWPEPEKARALMLDGNDLYRASKLPQALDKYEEAIKLDPKSAELNYRLSQALYFSDKTAASLGKLAIAASLEPNNKTYLLAYANALKNSGEHNAEAQTQFEKYLKLFPNDVPARYEAARTAEKAGDFKRAEQLYLDCCRRDPHKDGDWIAAARVERLQDDNAVAFQTLLKGLEANPNSAFIHRDLGDTYADRHQKAEATREFKRAAQLRPAMADAMTAKLEQLNGTTEAQVCLVRLTKRINSMIVEVVINEKYRGHFVVDSGADVCVIKPEIARAAGIDLSHSRTVQFGSSSGVGVAKLTKIKTLRVGDVREHDVDVFVNDMPVESDGLLGMSFLNRFNFSLNPTKGVLELSKKSPAN